VKTKSKRYGPGESARKIGGFGSGVFMRYLKYFASLAILMLPLAYSQAQVRVGIGIGVGPGVVVGPPPACAYGYYNYYPYACAPYGYYGPQWFLNGVFIGAGPWYHRYWGGDWDHDRWRHEGYWARPYARAWHHDGRGWYREHDGYGRGYAREGYRAERGFHGREFRGSRR
jgi:hypothetical protein